jgi:hypothetical protein
VAGCQLAPIIPTAACVCGNSGQVKCASMTASKVYRGTSPVLLASSSVVAGTTTFTLDLQSAISGNITEAGYPVSTRLTRVGFGAQAWATVGNGLFENGGKVVGSLPTAAGTYSLEVLVGGFALSESPLQFTVLAAAPSLALSRATGPGFTVCEDGTTCSFALELYDSFMNRATGSFSAFNVTVSVAGTTYPASIDANGTVSYSLSATAGTGSIVVGSPSIHIANSPSVLTVLPSGATSPAHSTLTPDPLSPVAADHPGLNFTLTAKNKFGTPTSVVGLSWTAVAILATPHIAGSTSLSRATTVLGTVLGSNQPGDYSVMFPSGSNATVWGTGTYRLFVRGFGADIVNSPFELVVTPGLTAGGRIVADSDGSSFHSFTQSAGPSLAVRIASLDRHGNTRLVADGTDLFSVLVYVNSTQTSGYELVETVPTALMEDAAKLATHRAILPGSRTGNYKIVLIARSELPGGTSAGTQLDTQFFSLTQRVAPEATTLQFHDSGAMLELMFDTNTNRGGSAFLSACSNVVQFAGQALGTSGPLCRWVNDRTLRLILGSNPTVLPGHQADLRPNVMQTAAGNSAYSAQLPDEPARSGCGDRGTE